eukprot:jgi/Tetstr1/432424/TSEL_000187.t1
MAAKTLQAHSTSALLALSLLLAGATSTAGGLRFDAQGGFQLLQLTDMHFGENAAKDARTVKVLEALLEVEVANSSLALLSGDMVSGYAWDSRGSGQGGPAAWTAGCLAQLLGPLHHAGLPYAAVLGNHDAEAGLSRVEVLQLIGASGGSASLTRLGYQTGDTAGNYWLDVASSRPGSDGAVALRIWMLDSGRHGCNGTPGWGCVPRQVVSWLEATAARLPPAPGLAVVHIPPPQAMHAWDFGGPVVGRKGEPVNCPSADTHLHGALRAAGVQLVLSGHDHDNNFAAAYDGITYAYGQKTGYGSYGPPQGVLRGARVLRLTERDDGVVGVETWIRLEDGSREDQAPAAHSLRGFQLMCDAGGTVPLQYHRRRGLISGKGLPTRRTLYF